MSTTIQTTQIMMIIGIQASDFWGSYCCGHPRLITTCLPPCPAAERGGSRSPTLFKVQSKRETIEAISGTGATTRNASGRRTAETRHCMLEVPLQQHNAEKRTWQVAHKQMTAGKSTFDQRFSLAQLRQQRLPLCRSRGKMNNRREDHVMSCL